MTCLLLCDDSEKYIILQKQMKKLHVDVLTTWTSTAESFVESLKGQIKRCDFVIIVITNKDYLYNIGFVEGVGKPYLVIDKNDKIKSKFLKNRVFVNSVFSEPKLLRSIIKNFIEGVSFKNELRKSNNKRNARKYNLSKILAKIDQLEMGIDLEDTIGKLFKEVDLNFVQNKYSRDYGADFVIWNDKFTEVIGDQIVVEVKYGSTNRIKTAYHQVSEYLNKTSLKCGIVIYHNKTSPISSTDNELSSLNPLIIFFSAIELTKQLENHSLTDIIIEKRNNIIKSQLFENE